MNEKFKELIPYIIIVFIIVIIRTFFYTPIRVNGESMEKTQINGEIMILNKIGPKTSGYKRFDIVVLKNNDSYLIKRIIGLPNEKIEYIDNRVLKLVAGDYENIPAHTKHRVKSTSDDGITLWLAVFYDEN